MLDFLFIEGISGTPVYWCTIDTGSGGKTGEDLARAIVQVRDEIRDVCGDKVETITTDRTRANKLSWRDDPVASFRFTGIS